MSPGRHVSLPTGVQTAVMNVELWKYFFLVFSSPCSRKLPFGVGGQLQLRDVGEHRPVAGGQTGDPDQRGVGVHGGVGIQGHLLGCKRQTVIVSEEEDMMCVETRRQREETEDLTVHQHGGE